MPFFKRKNEYFKVFELSVKASIMPFCFSFAGYHMKSLSKLKEEISNKGTQLVPIRIPTFCLTSVESISEKQISLSVRF